MIVVISAVAFAAWEYMSKKWALFGDWMLAIGL